MSSESKKSEGTFEKLGGTVKKGIGEAIGDERMEAEGRARELRGDERREEGKSEERAKGTVDKAVGAVKNRAGALIGDEKMQAEGRARELDGEARRHQNR